MFTERHKMPIWARLASSVVIGALLAGCGGKTYGYVTSTPDAASPTPITEPYCDAHMLTIEPPNFGLDSIDPHNLPVLSENLIGPSGVGEITGMSVVKNPRPEYVTNVKNSAKANPEQVDINVDTATVVEFGIEGKDSTSCAPFTMLLGTEQPDGTRPAYVGFATDQIDADGNGEPDLDVLVPSFDGNIDVFLPMGQVDAVPGDNKVHLGTIDQLDPESIQPLFEVDQVTGKVVFYPPFYQGETGSTNQPVAVVSDANFAEVSYKTGDYTPDNILTPTPAPVITATPVFTPTPEATPTIEVKQYPICTPENFKNCEIPYQDLFNGNYLNWLKTLPVEEFDPSTFDKIRCIGPSDGTIIAGGAPDANFKDTATQRFRRGFTFGTTTIKDGEVGYNFFGQRSYVIEPAYAYSDSLGHGTWLILVFPSTGWPDNQVVGFINKWVKSDIFAVIGNKFFSGVNSPNNSEDPLVVNTFNLTPDMQSRLDSYQTTCDPAFISGEGIVLETNVSVK